MKIIETIKKLLPPKKEKKYLCTFIVPNIDIKVILMSLRLLFEIESNEVTYVTNFENETQNTSLLDVMLTEKQAQIFMDHMAKVFNDSEELYRIV